MARLAEAMGHAPEVARIIDRHWIGIVAQSLGRQDRGPAFCAIPSTAVRRSEQLLDAGPVKGLNNVPLESRRYTRAECAIDLRCWFGAWPDGFSFRLCYARTKLKQERRQKRCAV